MSKKVPHVIDTNDAVGFEEPLAGAGCNGLKEKEVKGKAHQMMVLGNSAAMRRVDELVERAARVDLPVLISGESGTGKELVAQEIHRRSERKLHPFVAVNTGALPSELIASSLFGHMRGAFTGALQSRPGYFAEADGGTLFLDEIATMEERTQVALLRALENKTFRPVGAKNDKTSDVRIIAATNINLQQAVAQGRFREDLLYRLMVLHIALPPLRARPEDIGPLSAHFVRLISAELELNVTGLSQDALAALQAYAWPGNARELKNAVAQAAVYAGGGVIEPDHLPQRIQRLAVLPQSLQPARASAAVQQAAADGPPPDADDESDTGPASLSFDKQTDTPATVFFFPLGSTLYELEKAYVLNTLEFVASNKTRAAEILGISRKALYGKLGRWNGR